MKFSLVLTPLGFSAAMLCAFVTAAPKPDSFDAAVNSRSQGSVTYIENWDEAGMKRYRFSFTGCCTSDYGQEFMNAFRNEGGVTENWQCWKDSATGTWFFDNSEVEGAVGADIIARGINQVTGQTCDQIGYVGCGA